MEAIPQSERFCVRAELKEMRVVRARLTQWLQKLRVTDTTRDELTLVMDEATTNIVRHAYPPQHAGRGVIDVEFTRDGSELVLRLWDDGIQRREEDCVGRPLGEPGESGMGMNLIRILTSSLRFERTADGRNLLELRRRLVDGEGARLA
jgi:anti-sigma regulatory factor (Ser/Thr protein kinase)